MTRTMTIGVILALGPATAPSAIGQDSAASAPNGPGPASQNDRRQAKPEFKVAFWHRRADPSASLNTQAYDLRRGEYDRRAVEGWLKRMETDFPAYVAFVRDIQLEGLPGATEDAKLAEAIRRERARIIDAHARAVRAGKASTSPSSSTSMRLSDLLHPGGNASAGHFTSGNRLGSGTFRGVPGSGGSSLAPSSPSFPHPYPYPRPHP